METFASSSPRLLADKATSAAIDAASLSAASPSLAIPMAMPTPSGPDLPPLPSISPPSSAFSSSSSFPTGPQPSPTWSPQEMQTLLAGLAQFPAEQFDAVTRYIKIAALLPGKCVRDVALQAKAVANCGGSGIAAAPWFSPPLPSPARASKRMKIEPFGGQAADQHQTDPFAMMPPTPTMTMASGDRRAGGSELDDDVVRQLDALLHDNVMAISTMRANLLGGKPTENAPQMTRFHDNCQALLSTLGGACVPVPPLPVRPDASLLPEPRASSSDQQTN